MKLAGRVAVVTGSSMGIGEAIAAAFLREGARVVVNSRDQKRADDAAARLAKGGAETLALAADVSTRAGSVASSRRRCPAGDDLTSW